MPKQATDPTLEVEEAAFIEGFAFVIGLDEVGRGAIAGPVVVGAAALQSPVAPFPEGLRDSKLLSEKKRESIAPAAQAWCAASAVGFASAAEIDEMGITRTLGHAARRALLELRSRGIPVEQSLILLDGSHDWLSPVLQRPLSVRTRVKADRDCASVAAASVLAKVARDALLRELADEHPAYGWASNKGYGSAQHYAALAEHGVTPWHRASWIRGL